MTPGSSSDDELAFAGAARQAELLRDRQVSARELVALHLERIERVDPRLNAFRVVLGEQALAEAERAQARLDAGETAPLLGVPVAIKDEFDVAGQLNTLGCATSDEPVREDSEVVRRLRAGGAIPIGITNVPELTIWPFTETKTWGRTRNPWDPDRVPGGSSGGSGAAVAAGLAPVALGSDGAGSIRIPAASC
ncbi:MAG: amidase family protein, partial [Solirubrobacterales bacterium]